MSDDGYKCPKCRGRFDNPGPSQPAQAGSLDAVVRAVCEDVMASYGKIPRDTWTTWDSWAGRQEHHVETETNYISRLIKIAFAKNRPNAERSDSKDAVR